jgi:hypothetical protein
MANGDVDEHGMEDMVANSCLVRAAVRFRQDRFAGARGAAFSRGRLRILVFETRQRFPRAVRYT